MEGGAGVDRTTGACGPTGPDLSGLPAVHRVRVASWWSVLPAAAVGAVLLVAGLVSGRDWMVVSCGGLLGPLFGLPLARRIGRGSTTLDPDGLVIRRSVHADVVVGWAEVVRIRPAQSASGGTSVQLVDRRVLALPGVARRDGMAIAASVSRWRSDGSVASGR